MNKGVVIFIIVFVLLLIIGIVVGVVVSAKNKDNGGGGETGAGAGASTTYTFTFGEDAVGNDLATVDGFTVADAKTKCNEIGSTCKGFVIKEGKTYHKSVITKTGMITPAPTGLVVGRYEKVVASS
jgi:hypothetical protein